MDRVLGRAFGNHRSRFVLIAAVAVAVLVALAVAAVVSQRGDRASANEPQTNKSSANLRIDPDEGTCPKAKPDKLPPDALATVERFGARLKSVNPQAAYDESVIARDIRRKYGAFVTPELLEWWTTNPQRAPGSVVSSPWPDEIEVLEAREVEEGLFRVEGDVIYMSSAEIAQGGVAARERVVLSVREGRDGTWRISEYGVLDPPRE